MASAPGIRGWLRRLLSDAGRSGQGSAPRTSTVPARRASGSSSRGGGGNGAATAPQGSYAGDFHGVPDLAYSPVPDGRPDPGEIVWTWVPYEEDATQGKDRPVLLVGRDGDLLLALPLTSKDHDRDEAQERRAGREWVDIGSGDWDRQGRPSEVRVNRILRIEPAAIRREGAVLQADRFAVVAAAVRAARS